MRRNNKDILKHGDHCLHDVRVAFHVPRHEWKMKSPSNRILPSPFISLSNSGGLTARYLLPTGSVANTTARPSCKHRVPFRATVHRVASRLCRVQPFTLYSPCFYARKTS
ncbi:hypothetical protein TNCV_4101761 [Trichonephila clavipes]|nr:hypothetical protein TNCV_4101761 [Trichonephila clavipes]